jgi:hypothetical protein
MGRELTRMDAVIVAVALAVAALAIFIVVRYESNQVAPDSHLPALNGRSSPGPAAVVFGAPEPSPAPVDSAPGNSAPGSSAQRIGGGSYLASTGPETREDEAEDEPPSAEGRSSASTGSSSTTSSGSGGQSLLPIAAPSAALLPLPSSSIP